MKNVFPKVTNLTENEPCIFLRECAIGDLYIEITGNASGTFDELKSWLESQAKDAGFKVTWMGRQALLQAAPKPKKKTDDSKPGNSSNAGCNLSKIPDHMLSKLR